MQRSAETPWWRRHHFTNGRGRSRRTTGPVMSPLPINDAPEAVLASVVLPEGVHELGVGGKPGIVVDGRIAGRAFRQVPRRMAVAFDLAPCSVASIIARRIRVAASGCSASSASAAEVRV